VEIIGLYDANGGVETEAPLSSEDHVVDQDRSPTICTDAKPKNDQLEE
jgi:hypothetical protein